MHSHILIVPSALNIKFEYRKLIWNILWTICPFTICPLTTCLWEISNDSNVNKLSKVIVFSCWARNVFPWQANWIFPLGIFPRFAFAQHGEIIVLCNSHYWGQFMKWNVTPRIWQASNFYFFTDLCCSRIAKNTRFAARRRREARKGYFSNKGAT